LVIIVAQVCGASKHFFSRILPLRRARTQIDSDGLSAVGWAVDRAAGCRAYHIYR
jgi:hypothetical protein